MDTNPSASTVIDRLGGAAKVARICRIRTQAVSAWKRRGIPSARQQLLQVLHPDAFAPDDDAAAAQQHQDNRLDRDAA